MPLPIVGRGPVTPSHKPLDMRRLMSLAGDLQEAFSALDSQVLTPAIADELASELGASKVYLYAAAALMTQIPCDTSSPVRFELCIGGCQNMGAAVLLGHLLKRHAQRSEEKKSLFGIVTKRCLDHCDRAAVVLLHTPDGVVGMAHATVEKLDEAIAMVLDD